MRETAVAELPKFETMLSEIPGSKGKITMMQRAMFWLLHNAKGRIVTHRVIWDTLYGARPECDMPSSDVIKTHICHIRKKLPGWQITCHHGIGYSMVSRFREAAPDGQD
jgi:DNA-binding response OmpR family regulator